MRISIEKALFPFTESECLQKMFVGVIFYFIPVLLYCYYYFAIQTSDYSKTHNMFFINALFYIIVYIIALILPVITYGYIILSMHYEINNQHYLLPDWSPNFLFLFMRGITCYLINLIYFIPICIFGAIFYGMGMVLAFLFKNNPTISFVVLALILGFSILVGLFYALIFPFIQAAYAENFYFTDAFRLDKILSKLWKVFLDCILILLIIVVFSILIFFAFVIMEQLMIRTMGPVISLFSLDVLIVALPALSVYLTLSLQLTVANLYAQAYRIAKSK